MAALIALGVELGFGLGLWKFLMWTARPTGRVKPRVSGVLPGSVTLPSDTVGLA